MRLATLSLLSVSTSAIGFAVALAYLVSHGLPDYGGIEANSNMTYTVNLDEMTEGDYGMATDSSAGGTDADEDMSEREAAILVSHCLMLAGSTLSAIPPLLHRFITLKPVAIKVSAIVALVDTACMVVSQSLAGGYGVGALAGLQNGLLVTFVFRLRKNSGYVSLDTLGPAVSSIWVPSFLDDIML